MKIIWTLLILASFSLQGICYDKVSTTVVANKANWVNRFNGRPGSNQYFFAS